MINNNNKKLMHVVFIIFLLLCPKGESTTMLVTEQMNSIGWCSSLTFEFDLQHLIDMLNDVSVGAERVARAVNADLQAEVGL